MQCPTCHKPCRYANDEDRRKLSPFCSDRCKRVDLGAWFGEAYRVAAQTPPDHDRNEDDNGEVE